MPQVGLTVEEVSGQVFLRGGPAPERAALVVDDLLAILAESGFSDWAIDVDALHVAVQDCNHKTTPFVIPVAQRRDAVIRIEVAPDEMSAAVSLAAPQGGNAATVADLLQALSDAGISFGIDQAALVEACSAGVVATLPIATGLLAEDGIDTDFQELVPDASDRAPKVDADGLIDYREHGAIALVEPGAPLMRRIPPTPGVTGRTIRGAAIAPRPGRDEPFASSLSGAVVDPSDPNIIQASIAGQPVRVPHGVSVEPVLKVKEVNLATGNIYFDGTVIVEGDVNNTMKVQASGDIIVGGTVEGAQLQAGGNITVKGGIIARAQVQAAGSLAARFAEAAHLRAGTTIALDDMALESDMQAGNQILVGIKSPQRGRLVGGKAQAMMLLSAPCLGSSNAGVTQVVVGANPELEERYRVLQERIAKEKDNEDNLQKLIHHLTKVGDPKGMLEKVKASWRQAAKTWGQSLGERSVLDQALAQSRNAKVQIGVNTAGMVEMAFGSKKLRLRKEYSKGTFSVDTASAIVFTDPSGQAVTLG